jgi:ATP-dependent DNA helicase RecQ
MPIDPTDVLRRAFGYPRFRPGQEDLVRAVIAGRDALGVLPTGGGKSVCYQVPAMIMEGLTLVVTPLISLMEDQVVRARAVGLRAAALAATQSAAERRSVIARGLSGGLDLLFVSPERLATPGLIALAESVPIALLAVDEAHCISEWGHDFRPAYRAIGSVKRFIDSPTLALTASATPEVRSDIRDNLGLRDPMEVVRSFQRSNLWWGVERARSPADRVRRVHEILRTAPGAAIVYAPTRRTVEGIRDSIARLGIRVEAYHAGLPPDERSHVQERFMNGRVRVVAATNAFGMGIDKADVRTVIHLQLPGTLEAYYQEAGRAGRDGGPSRCIALHRREDRRLAESFLDEAHPSSRILRGIHRRLRAAARADRCVEVDHPDVLRALGRRPTAWMAGEPHGPLAALERAGAIRPLHAHGTRAGELGSLRCTVLVLDRFDYASVVRRRRVVASKIQAVQRYARTRGCRSGVLLRYFGEIPRSGCRRCDRCGWDSKKGFADPDG